MKDLAMRLAVAAGKAKIYNENYPEMNGISTARAVLSELARASAKTASLQSILHAQELLDLADEIGALDEREVAKEMSG